MAQETPIKKKVILLIVRDPKLMNMSNKACDSEYNKNHSRPNKTQSITNIQ